VPSGVVASRAGDAQGPAECKILWKNVPAKCEGAGVGIRSRSSHIALNNLILPSPLAILFFSGIATYYLAQYLIIRGAILESS
jgi:hypothetical protein